MSVLLDSLAAGFDGDEARRAPLDEALRDGLPHARVEAWKYTPLRALERRRFAVAEHVAIDPALLERELQVQTAKALEENATSAKPKPEQVIHNNIIPGRMRKFLEEVTLLNQKFVINPDITVAQAAKEAGVEVLAYERIAVGEGIEKKEEDFAAEVAKTMAGA